MSYAGHKPRVEPSHVRDDHDGITRAWARAVLRRQRETVAELMDGSAFRTKDDDRPAARAHPRTLDDLLRPVAQRSRMASRYRYVTTDWGRTGFRARAPLPGGKRTLGVYPTDEEAAIAVLEAFRAAEGG